MFKAAKKRKKAASITGSKDVKLSRKVISRCNYQRVAPRKGSRQKQWPSQVPKAQRACSTGVTWMDAHQQDASSPLHCCFSQSDRRRLGDGCLRWMTLLFDGRSTHVKASRSFSPFSPTCEGSIAATSNQLETGEIMHNWLHLVGSLSLTNIQLMKGGRAIFWEP